MLAAFMSTHDSYLLCWSSVITQDVIAPMFGDRMSTKARVRLTRVLIVVIGGYVLYWGLFYTGREDIWDYMAVTGAIYFSGAFALLVGGLYWKRASSTGAVLALLGGIFAIFGLTPVQDAIGIKVPSERIGLISIALTTGLMVVGSLVFPDRKKTHTTGKPAEGGN
jgi:SSS family solute:Na+ symporter